MKPTTRSGIDIVYGVFCKIPQVHADRRGEVRFTGGLFGGTQYFMFSQREKYALLKEVLFDSGNMFSSDVENTLSAMTQTAILEPLGMPAHQRYILHQWPLLLRWGEDFSKKFSKDEARALEVISKEFYDKFRSNE